MRYANNEMGRIVNGVIFYFEEGDYEIATDVLDLIDASEKPPTSVAWSGECMNDADASHRLQTSGLAESDWLGIRLTIDDLPLLKEILGLFKEHYPALSQMVAEIEGELFIIKH